MDNIKKVRFRITGREPDKEEAEKLSSLQVHFTMPGGAEFSEAIKWFVIGLATAAGLVLFGYFMLSHFRGIGALILGLGSWFGAPVMLFMAFGSLFQLLRSPHKKTVDKAAQWFWLTSCLGDDAASARFGKEEYALSTMQRMFPDGAGFDAGKARKFIEEFRNKVGEAADRTTAAQRTDGWTQSSPGKEWKLVEDKEITPSLHRIFATLKVRDLLSKSNGNGKTMNIETARIQLEIEQYFIRAGEAWFPYDIAPSITEITDDKAKELPDPDAEDGNEPSEAADVSETAEPSETTEPSGKAEI